MPPLVSNWRTSSRSPFKKSTTAGALSKSLASHLAGNSKQEITVELHAFGKDSPAKDKTRRRAYESELIRSRKPRLNIAP